MTAASASSITLRQGDALSRDSQNRFVDNRPLDSVVVGAGLAGLIAAATLAREGRSVALFEKARLAGGRGGTTDYDGVLFNLGAHALYCQGHAFPLLKELGVPFTGRFPQPGKTQLELEGRTSPAPVDLRAILTSPLFTATEKWRLFRLMQKLRTINPLPYAGQSARDWIRSVAGDGNLARFVAAYVRLVTYCADHDLLDASAAIAQLKSAINGGVWYVDGGWQTLIEGLRQVASGHGATFYASTPVRRLLTGEQGVQVVLADGTSVRAKTAIVAAGPHDAATMLDLPPNSPLRHWADHAHPVRAACFDVALTQLSRPEEGFTLGLDASLYFSNHSRTAKLGPENVHVVHLMKYLSIHDDASPEERQAELEAYLDRLQPGWRDHVRARRFLPGITVAHSIPEVRYRGTAGRPSVTVAERPGVFLAGDWVGPEAQLADASAASGHAAATKALQLMPVSA